MGSPILIFSSLITLARQLGVCRDRGQQLPQTIASSSVALAALLTGVVLTSGEARATTNWYQDVNSAFTYRTDDANGPLGQFDTGWSPFLGDKRMKILNGGLVNGMTIGTNDVEWSYKQLQNRPWHVDLDQVGNIDIASNLMYRVQIDPSQNGLNICSTFPDACKESFYTVDFSIQANNSAVPTKSIYEAIGDTPGALLLTLNNGEVKTFPSSVSDIIVKIEWPAGQAIGDMGDNYNQVPGPLPLLGAGVAFGFSRKLRGRVKAYSLR